jgi:peptidyl-prolyl cis-trans isomerase SurA
MNMRDDDSKISQMALEEKKALVLDKWLKTNIPTYSIMVDNESSASCPSVQKFASTDTKGF